MTSKILPCCTQFPKFDHLFDYCSVIGKLGYLETGSCPDIAYIAHQCVQVMSKPHTKHRNTISWLGCYFKRTRNKGMVMQPKRNQGLEVYVDANFAGNWAPDKVDNIDNSRSCHCFVI